MMLKPSLVIQMAVELAEQQGAFYRELSSRFPPESDEATLLARLASEEEEHRRAFEEMERSAGSEGGGGLTAEQAERVSVLMNRKVLKRYADRAERLCEKGSTPCTDFFLLAAMVESDALLFYRSLEPFVAPAHRHVLEAVIREEGSHREFVLDLFCRSRRFKRGESVRKALEQDFATSYREAEVRDLALLGGILDAFSERSSADIASLVEGAMDHFRRLMDPSLMLFFVLTGDGGQMVLRRAIGRQGMLEVTREPVGLDRLAAARAWEAGTPIQIRDRKDWESCRACWDFAFCRSLGEEPERMVAIPVPGVGLLEMMNVKPEFGLSSTNALLLEVIGGVIRVLCLGKAGLDRLGEFYDFLSYSAETVSVDELYERTMRFVSRQMGGTETAIFLYSADRKKVFLGGAYGFQAEELRFVPRPSTESPGLSVDASTQVQSVSWNGNEIPEVSILREVSGLSPVTSALMAVLRDDHGQPMGSLWVLGHGDGFSPQDGMMLEFFGRHLAQAINRRKQTRELERIQKEGEFLSRYFSPNLLKRLRMGEEIHKEGVSEEITVLFADIRGFTAMSERMDPQGVVRLLNSFFGTMVRIILQNDGVIDKFIGDAVFVYWGVPVKHKNDTLLAVLTALAMQEEVKHMKERGRLPEDFQVGIGVNVGPAVLGNIGSETRLEFTAIGDTVNTASRLCGIAPGGEIIVSGPVWKRIFYDLEVVPFGKKVLTGKTQEILTYRVQSLKDDYFTTYMKAF